MPPNTNLLVQAQNASISAAVGPNQPNKPQDVLTVQRLINGFYSSVQHLPSPVVAETGNYDVKTQDAISKVERDYFYGVADPLHRIEPNNEVFEFLRHGIIEAHANPLDPQLSHEMYQLAAIMVPLGVDKLVKTSDPNSPPHNQPGNIRTYLPGILRALDSKGLGDVDMVLMALATIRAESSGFKPLDEKPSSLNTSQAGFKTKHPFDRYDNRSILGNRGAPDGASFKGRGFVQLTGRSNYRQISKQIGLGDLLVKKPYKANDPDIAALILAQFLKNHEQQVRNALKRCDLIHARRVVNGGSYGLFDFRMAYNAGRQYLHMSLVTRIRRSTKRISSISKAGGAK